MPPALLHRTLISSVLFAAALTVSSARAADYALRVEAPPECVDEPRLLEAIRVRSPGFTPAAWEAAGASRFLVRFLPQGSSVVVEIETTDATGARSLRSVPAQDCPEAVRATAWILTLLVDPNAAALAGEAPPAAQPLNTAPTAGEPPTPAPASATVAPAPVTPSRAQAVVAPQVNPQQTQDSLPPPMTEPEDGPRTWQISVGAFGGVLQSALPETPLGLGVFFEAAWEREHWFRPSARLAGLDAGSGVSSESDRGDVAVSFFGGRLSLCPARTSRRQPLSGRFCALVEVGQLSGKGQATTGQGSAAPTWYAAGPALGLELQPWSFLALELEAALILPFNRDRFVFEPDPVQVGYEVPPISFSLALGLAWRSDLNK